MNQQELFDKAYLGVMKQGGPSVSTIKGFDNSSAYHGDDNCKCSVGHLLEDKDYNYKIEGAPVSSFIDRIKYLKEHEKLVNSLQSAHDLASQYNVNSSKQKFLEHFGMLCQEIAIKFNLNIPNC